MKRKIKVLGIFGNVANAGQERANSDVYKMIANENNYELLVLVNDRGFHWHLQPFFEQNSISFKKIRFPWGIYAHSSLLHIVQWILDIIINNMQFVFNYIKFKPDYIHIGNEYMYKTLIVPLSLCRAKIVFRLGDRPFTNHFYNKWFWKIISKEVDTFVCDTNFIHGLLKSIGRNDCKDIVLYHPAPEHLKIRTPNMTKEPGHIVLGYVGQIKESKGVKLIVQCAKQVCEENKNVEFWFAGNIENNDFYNNSIKSLLDEMPDNIGCRVRFLGQIEDIDSFYSSIDVHIAPSIAEEPYGLVMVEAKKIIRPPLFSDPVECRN